jgi:hypothetical protein
MALDFQQIHQQIKVLGEDLLAREQLLQMLRETAEALLKEYSTKQEVLRQKIQLVISNYDPALRCALPTHEPLDAKFPMPEVSEQATILAADGSQSAPDRNLEVEFGLINVSAIQARYGSPEPPLTTIHSRLLFDQELENLTDATLALQRDLNERKMLVDLAARASPPVITFTDGPMELWGGSLTASIEASAFQRSMEEYRQVLSSLFQLGVATAGYVDKPNATTVVRLLEVAMTAQDELLQIKKLHPLHGVRDIHLYRCLLQPGERSAVFKIQSQYAKSYPNEMSLHFFYLNVGGPRQAGLARVEIPAWVAEDTQKLNNLHAALVHQCQVMGSRPYPYLLHRAHESALVTFQDREQVNQMLAIERRCRSVQLDEASYKQSAKDLPGRTPYQSRRKPKR